MSGSTTTRESTTARQGTTDGPAAATHAGVSGTKRLVLADPLSAEGMAVLEAAERLQVEDLSGLERHELGRAMAGAHGLIVRSRTTVDAELLDAAEGLEAIGRAGAGVDNIDVEAATRRGIAVLNAPGGNTVSTAELAFALLLATARKVAAADRSVREGRWERKALRGVQLQGKTLGVVGAGRIGSAIARRAKAFGMTVVVHDPYLTEERAADLGLERAELERLLAEAHAVTLHVPLTDATAGMIGPREIGMMKEGAFLVNAARGGIVDEAALAEALEGGRLGGAALDVYEREPLPADSPLRGVPNLVLTPHLGAATDEAQREVAVEIASVVRDALLDGDYRAALNAPYVKPGETERVEPVMELGRRMGVLLAEITEGRCDGVEVRYAGSVPNVLRPLAAAALEGYLRRIVDRPLNVVNALAIAAERGIQVGRVRLGDVADYANYVELVGRGGGARAVEEGTGAGSRRRDRGSSAETPGVGRGVVVGGALLGDAQHARIVKIGAFHVDTVPRGVLLMVRNRDVPGVIGDVGTKLGAAGVNIAEYHLGRREVGGEALGLIRVDDAVPDSVLEALRALDAVIEVRQVRF